MASPSFQTLPAEIILAIIERVEFSPRNFASLTLVNHHFHQLMVNRGRQLLHDIATIQFPHALMARSYPRFAFATNNDAVSMTGLKDLMYGSRIVNVFDAMFRTIRNGMIKKNLQLGQYLAPNGWNKNFLCGLHVFHRLRCIPREERDICRRGSENFLRSPEPLEQKISSLIETYIASLPPTMCLAIRHGSLMGLEMAKFIARKSPYQRIDLDQESVPSNLFSERTMRLTIEHDLFGLLSFCQWTFSDNENQQEKADLDFHSFQFQEIQTMFKEVHTTGYPGAGPSGRGYPRSDQFITQKIREEVLGRWEQFVEENPQTIADLQSENVNDTDGVRALVESFLDGFEDQREVRRCGFFGGNEHTNIFQI